jgi:phosphate starvation-inducible PhoH-like protein
MKKAAREKKPASGKRQRRQELESQLRNATANESAVNDDAYENVRRPIPKLEGQTEAQVHYILAMQSKQLTFSAGPAGTGKTYCCTTRGAQLLMRGKIDKLIVTRPAIEAGRGLGFLPGTIEEKFAPYFAPFKAILEKHLGKGHLEYLIRKGKVEIAPLEYIRGTTFENAFVILDEAQNTTPTQMKLFLTRIGETATVVVNGDTDQQDIPGLSGLSDALNRLTHLKQVGVANFTAEDVVRSGLVRDLLVAYART